MVCIDSGRRRRGTGYIRSENTQEGHIDIGEKLVVHSREEWRDWLACNHAERAAIWLVFFKKGTGKRTVDYAESVEEALCYGWIDGQMKSIDGESYAIRFSPRRRRSKWSESNRAAALRLARAGRMAEAGLAAMPDDVRVDTPE